MKKWMMTACCLGLLALVGCGAQQAPVEKVAPRLRVACVGDSITEGFGGHSYVEVLAKQGDWVLGNFGECGTTALAQDAPSYRQSYCYKDSLAWEADVVVLMLGTNDTAYWQGNARFEADYADLVDTYCATGAKVVLCTPLAPVEGLGENGYGIEVAHFDAVCAAIRTVAEARGLTLVDVYAQSLGQAMTLADGVHPNAKGAACIAQAVRAGIDSIK